MKAIVGLLAIALFFSCQKSSDQSIPGPREYSTISWLALGDSYTIGQGVDTSERFPAQTAELLKQKKIRVNKLTYIATSGWTSSDLLAATKSFGFWNYDLVTLLIGVNDQFLSIDTSVYKKNLISLLEYANVVTQGNSSEIIIISIPDYSVTPFGKKSDSARIRKEIDMFNNINLRISKEYSCSYLDITPLSREASWNPELTSKDGLHPSGLAYKSWAKLLGAVISKTP